MNRKLLTIAFALLVTITSLQVSYADCSLEKETQENIMNFGQRMEYIHSNFVDLNINSNGLAKISAKVYAYDDVDSVQIIAKLQKYSGNGWETIKKYKKKIYSSRLDLFEKYNVSKGTYRIKVTFKASKNGNHEYLKVISSTQGY